jgi:hypothetical protein
MGLINIGRNDITLSPSVVGNPCGISLSSIGTSDVLHLNDIG